MYASPGARVVGEGRDSYNSLMLTPPAALEAILFAAGEPVEKKRLAQKLEISVTDLSLAIVAFEASLASRGLALINTDEEIELRTAPEAAELVKKLWESERGRDLGKAGLETLAVIAYQEGATRGDIDWVRGVNSSASVRTLLLRGLIERREDPTDKRRARYALTSEALAHLGIKRLTDLPRHAELARGVEAHVRTSDVAATSDVPESAV